MADDARPTTSQLTLSLTDRLVAAAQQWARSQHELVTLAPELAESAEWIDAGSATPAHHLAAIADVEPCTAREWLRVGTRVRGLPTIARLFAEGALSYAKVRALVTIATPENEGDLVDIAVDTPAGDLRRALAAWLRSHCDAEELAAHHTRRRAVWWRTDSDGMVTFTFRLAPQVAAILISVLTVIVMRCRPRPDRSTERPTLAQQRADAVEQLLTEGSGRVDTEVILHVRGDGCTADDGTPIPDTVIADIASGAFIRALIHDAESRPINASERHRHPTARQRRVVSERDRTCCDCGRADLLEFDHVPPWSETGHTLVEELRLRCAPCHRKRHQELASRSESPRSPD